jgi:hypothetical protein
MANGTYLRFEHLADVYRREIVVNDAGQKSASFILQRAAMPCAYQSISSERRTAPYIDNVDEFQIIVSHLFQDNITYQGRIENIRDRYGNVILDGPFEITKINKRTGFNGKVHHVVADIRLVVENG